MTRRRLIWIGVALMPVVAFFGLAAVGGKLYYPVPSTESAFIHNYSAEPVISRFRSDYCDTGMSGMTNGTAGMTYVTNELKADHRLFVADDKAEAMMTALDDDAQYQIERSGAEIIGHAGNAVKGYHFSYRTGQIIGSLTIGPPRNKPLNVVGPELRLLPFGTRCSNLLIKAEEHWFPER